MSFPSDPSVRFSTKFRYGSTLPYLNYTSSVLKMVCSSFLLVKIAVIKLLWKQILKFKSHINQSVDQLINLSIIQTLVRGQGIARLIKQSDTGKFLLTVTAIDLHSHRYATIPSCGSKADVECSDWWVEIMINDSVAVCVSRKFLIQEDSTSQH